MTEFKIGDVVRVETHAGTGQCVGLCGIPPVGTTAKIVKMFDKSVKLDGHRHGIRMDCVSLIHPAEPVEEVVDDGFRPVTAQVDVYYKGELTQSYFFRDPSSEALFMRRNLPQHLTVQGVEVVLRRPEL